MNVTLLALAAGVPIGTVFALMVGLRWSAVRAMGVGWVLATLLGLGLWRMESIWWAAAALYGVLQAVEIVLIVFGAILLMNTLKGSGALTTIRWHFTHITGDRRAQMLLIGLGFTTIIEGAAGFGTPAALAAPLLIGLGFPPLAAAIFGLFFNGLQPPFGAAGTPIIGGIGSVIDQGMLPPDLPLTEFLMNVSGWTAVVTGAGLVFWGLVGVFLMLLWFGHSEERSLRGALRGTLPVLPFALLLGAITGGTQFVVAWFFGAALPDIAAGFAVLGIGVVLAHMGVLMPKEEWTFPDRHDWPDGWLAGLDRDHLIGDEPRKAMPVWLAWTPYLLVALVLLVTRWPGLGVFEWIRGFTLDVEGILGQDLDFRLRYLYLPGIVPFLPVAVLTILIHRMELSAAGQAWRESARQVFWPAVTLLVAVSMTQVMIQSRFNPLDRPGMMQALSQVLAMGAGAAVPFVSPWIGALGAFMTGSSTSSNILFSALQHDAARDVGLSRTIIVALQNAGGGIGNLISVLNIAAVCGVVGIAGKEGELLRKMVIPTILLGLFASVLGLVLAYTVTGVY